MCFTDALQQGASQFEQQAGKLKSKFWLQNLKVYNYSFFSFITISIMIKRNNIKHCKKIRKLRNSL